MRGCWRVRWEKKRGVLLLNWMGWEYEMGDKDWRNRSMVLGWSFVLLDLAGLGWYGWKGIWGDLGG